MPEDSDERTEPATQKRKNKAKEEGQVIKSTEVNNVISLVTAGCLIFIGGNFIWKNLFLFFHLSFASFPKTDFTQQGIYAYFITIFINFMKTILPFMVGMVMAGFLSSYIQIGLTFSPKCIEPKLEKISPLKGFKKIFSIKSIAELVKSLFKIFVIGYISWSVVKNEVDLIMVLGDMEVKQIIQTIASIMIKIGAKVCLGMLILAAADYGYQFWEYIKNLKMTKQEVKEEMKDTEGNPQIKSRIKSIQRQSVMQRMMSDVPKADVVITNPTHLAVALKYDKNSMFAPKVIAKGARLIAEKIKKIAAENQIPVIENKPLARSLFKLCDIGREIPKELYRAVAEILAYIYKLNGNKVA